MKDIIYVLYKLNPIYERQNYYSSYYFKDADHYLWYRREGTKNFEWAAMILFDNYKSLVRYCSRNHDIFSNMSKNMKETSVPYEAHRYQCLYYILKFVDNECFEICKEQLQRDSDIFSNKDIGNLDNFFVRLRYPRLKAVKFRKSPVPYTHKNIPNHKMFGKSKGLGFRQLKRVQTDPDYGQFKSGKLIYRQLTRKRRHTDKCWKSQYKVRHQYLVHVKKENVQCFH